MNYLENFDGLKGRMDINPFVKPSSTFFLPCLHTILHLTKEFMPIDSNHPVTKTFLSIAHVASHLIDANHEISNMTSNFNFTHTLMIHGIHLSTHLLVPPWRTHFHTDLFVWLRAWFKKPKRNK